LGAGNVTASFELLPVFVRFKKSPFYAGLENWSGFISLHLTKITTMNIISCVLKGFFVVARIRPLYWARPGLVVLSPFASDVLNF